MDDKPAGGITKAKNRIGFLLVFIGAGIALWVFFNICSIFDNPDKLIAFQELISGQFKYGMIGDKKAVELIIPPEILAYIIPLALLSIAAGVAGVFITGGVKLLDSDLQVLIRRFSTLKHQVNTRLENFTNSLNKNKDQNP